MLVQKFPDDSPLLKYNANPLSDYDCTNNLNLMKKVLNKRGLQLNLNIQTVLTSKNNFELAKWYKSLFDANSNNEQPPISNYASLPHPKDNASTYREVTKKSLEQTPKKQSE